MPTSKRRSGDRTVRVNVTVRKRSPSMFSASACIADPNVKTGLIGGKRCAGAEFNRTPRAAVKAALGEHAHKLVVSSTKSMTGHLLGGAGGVESVFTVLSVHHQQVPPTINLDQVDPECDLDYCANTARDLPIEYALKNNFGFGGTNGSLIFKRF